MHTDKEHLQSLKARLHNRLLEIEREKKEYEDALRELDRIYALAMKKGTSARIELEETGKRRNTNLKAKVEAYIQRITSTAPDAVVTVPAVVKYLQENGIEGSKRSLYTNVYVTMNRIAKRPGSRFVFSKGKGSIKKD
jgi:hypothetical protein